MGVVDYLKWKSILKIELKGSEFNERKTDVYEENNRE